MPTCESNGQSEKENKELSNRLMEICSEERKESMSKRQQLNIHLASIEKSLETLGDIIESDDDCQTSAKVQ